MGLHNMLANEEQTKPRYNQTSKKSPLQEDIGHPKQSCWQLKFSFQERLYPPPQLSVEG